MGSKVARTTWPAKGRGGSYGRKHGQAPGRTTGQQGAFQHGPGTYNMDDRAVAPGQLGHEPECDIMVPHRQGRAVRLGNRPRRAEVRAAYPRGLHHQQAVLRTSHEHGTGWEHHREPTFADLEHQYQGQGQVPEGQPLSGHKDRKWSGKVSEQKAQNTKDHIGKGFYSTENLSHLRKDSHLEEQNSRKHAANNSARYSQNNKHSKRRPGKTHYRIGEAKHPGPKEEQVTRQRKMDEFFHSDHTKKDYKNNWCAEKGLRIERIAGDGHCLYAALGKRRNLSSNEVRKILHDRAGDLWDCHLEFDHHQGALEDFKTETMDLDQWGGADQILMWT